MEKLEFFLASNGIYMLTFILLALGLFGMIACSNYMKKLMCMNVLQVAIIFFFLTFAQKEGGTIPVIFKDLLAAENYINPLPHALMLRLL